MTLMGSDIGKNLYETQILTPPLVTKLKIERVPLQSTLPRARLEDLKVF